MTTGRALTVVVAMLAAGAPAPASAAGEFDDSEIRHIVYPAWFGENPFSDLSEELDAARAGGKQGLMVLFTTEGCSYCYLFVKKSLGDPVLASRVRQHFETVGLEIFDDTTMTDPLGVSMPIKEYALREGAEFAPTLLFYDLDGQRVLKLVGYQGPERFAVVLDYLAGEHAPAASFRDYLARREEAASNASAAAGADLRPDPLFAKPPYALDRSVAPARRPLLVIFEQGNCAGCEQFHDQVLADSAVRESLGRFEVIRLDAADDGTVLAAPDGREVTPASWFRDAGFTRAPALVFFDEQGQQVLETDALVLRQRMMNSINFVLQRAYEKGWTYQRFARTQAIERRQEAEANPR
jgi:thioredoxin-related protein